MPLTRDFKDTVAKRAQTDVAFRSAMLSEAVDLLLGAETAAAKKMLRDYINATIGFEELARLTGLPTKSIMRMVGKAGNPRAENLFAVLSALQQATGVQLEVKAAA